MQERLDVVVIGGGIAGTLAALEAAAAGERVVLVRAGPGATALCSGAWQGPLPALLGSALERSGLPYVAVGGLLPHPYGELRECAHAGAAHAAAVPVAESCVCGIEGLAGFQADALARLWGSERSVQVRLPGTPAGGWSAVSLAAQLDRDAAPLGVALARLAPACRLILPAVLGLERHAEVRSQLSAAVGAEVAEALGVPPSVPGWRLDRALLAALAVAGVRVVHGRVVDRSARAGRVETVTVAGDVAFPTLAADRFVLATGRFVGGGVSAAEAADAVDVAHGRGVREAVLVERALGCDVWVDFLGERFTRVQPVALTSALRSDAQPLLGAGVHVAADGRPVGAHGRVLYENVVARGSVIANVAPGLGSAAGAPA